jgi:predicted site-specific integrase-resolvase
VEVLLIADPLHTIPEVAQRERVHPETVRRWIRLGLLESVKLSSGSVRVRESVLKRFEGTSDQPPPVA